ncbi:hypothetical protein USDA257_c39210 [Sinorhizobium fredii USDA 257]|uniref:Uncharacterized protein n=1 Tax=Sinorhizobium fredii (strain USDA 257) TaxID=1185652 RepID=I3X9A9_SINF2|nr:hypothetical protein USDA257_c39210 [Sinorhizobium fredii USDA 257]
MALPYRDMGALAVRMLVDMIAGRPPRIRSRPRASSPSTSFRNPAG